MAHQGCPDALSLVCIRYSESDLRSSRLREDVAGATDNYPTSFFFQRCDQSYMVDEVDVQKIVDFPLCEASLRREEPAVAGLRTELSYSCNEICSILWPKS